MMIRMFLKCEMQSAMNANYFTTNVLFCVCAQPSVLHNLLRIEFMCHALA